MAAPPSSGREVVSTVIATGVRPGDEQSAKAWDIAATVLDPEVPVLTIEDLGVLRGVKAEGSHVHVVMTPTYSGCPAIDQMKDDVTNKLRDAGFAEVKVEYTLAPAWTTDWMTESGKTKLEEYGIAPPTHCAAENAGPIRLSIAVKCPRCHSLSTKEISRFGSTSCKALFQCLQCEEPFDYFKVH